MGSREALATLLKAAFDSRHVDAALDHYLSAVEAFQQENCETAIAKVGKLIEAVLKALYVHVGQTVPRGRLFKVDKVIQALEQTPQGSHHDSIRLCIPRACCFGYDIASNRGARHDPDEIDPNYMDATVLISLCGWILAEMVRFSQKGAVEPDRAREMVNRLIAPRYPLIENVDGRVYFHGGDKTARDVALVLLLFAYPGRVPRQDIVDAIQRHEFTENAARVALTRLKGLVDDDGGGNLRLLAPGRQQAEKLIAALAETAATN
jgi:hypothetical protein